MAAHLCNLSTGKLRQDCEFKANLDYIASPYLEKYIYTYILNK
jgi:hypothetical protein